MTQNDDLMLHTMTTEAIAQEKNKNIELHTSADIMESTIREQMPRILELLLIDRTTSTPAKNHNIIWGNENYIQYGAQTYAPEAQMMPELVIGKMNNIIKPRALKSKELQKERTKTKAEVFTPTWIVKKQVDIIMENYKEDDLETLVRRKWLEITCGEAPYMVTRYDMGTGEVISLNERVGFLDRKLQKLNSEVQDKAEWQRLALEAYKSSYGFEWSGDSVLLARENLLYTYRDYYYSKWGTEPVYGLFEDIAKIISYNVFQMDGLKYIVPLSEKRVKVLSPEISLFENTTSEERWEIKPGKRVRIMNWETNKMEFFDKGVKKNVR